MAFTFCTNCGNKIEDGVIKCPYCGHIKGSERSYTYGKAPTEPKPQADEQPSDPYGQNPYTSNQDPYSNNPYGNSQAPSDPSPYGGTPSGGFYRQVNDRPMSIGLLIFSIINIVFGCCCSIGCVFGIIALVYTLNARQAPDDNEEIRRKKIALFMNITAIILTIAFIVSFSVAFTNGMVSL